ncbi:MAG: hypothetical protein HY660_15235 [Armatimonadetes bacterium]|nr:hypothetical protein [Armatimonadota bacterium]
MNRWSRLDLPVWILLAAMLVAGWAVKSAAEGRRFTFTDPGGTLRLAYPAGWFGVPGSTHVLEVRGPGAAGGFPDTIAVTKTPAKEGATPETVAEEDALTRGKDLPMYRVLSVRKARVAGRDGMLVRYAYVADPFDVRPDADRFPVAVGALEAVVVDRGTVYRIRFLAAASRFRQMERLGLKILQDVSL